MREIMTRLLFRIAVFIIVLSAGTALGAFLFRSVSPQGLEDAPALVDTPVTQRAIEDTRNVRLALELGPQVSLRSHSDGLITALTCQAGQTISSGDHIMTLGDQRVYAFATAIPLWRDLNVGDHGEDVTALHTELQRLGYLIDTDNRIGIQTLRSVATLLGFTELSDIFSYTTISPSSFVWLPTASVTLSSCTVSVGENITENTELAILDRPLLHAHVLDMPTDLLEGQRHLTVDGHHFPITEAGILEDPQALIDLQATPSYQRWLSSLTDEPAPPLDVTFSLNEATQVYAVSPSAIYDVKGNEACVLDHDTPRPVRILSSELGQTHILFPDGQAPPDSLPAPPRNALSCR